jgi:hypothetical protein
LIASVEELILRFERGKRRVEVQSAMKRKRRMRASWSSEKVVTGV